MSMVTIVRLSSLIGVALLVFALGAPAQYKSDGNCFVSLDAPLQNAPFGDDVVAKMREFFFHNLNVNGTGAVVAARGDVPALHGCCPGGYTYHWMRDGALSMAALQKIVNVDASGVDATFARSALKAYVGWIQRMQSQAAASAHTEPKWDIDTEKPYSGGWCRPQTDGPGLRALALMDAAAWKTGPNKDDLWKLIKFDLDWLAQGAGSIDLSTCDLWEETQDPNFLWNKATMREALTKGQAFAEEMGDAPSASTYLNAVKLHLKDPFSDHFEQTNGQSFLTECPANGAGESCKKYGKDVDGAVILSLIHTSWKTVVNQMHVAKTVESYNKLFCGLYPINTQDSSASVPGVLYGRYKSDQYGGGNPWVLLTASLASLLYQAGQSSQPLSADELTAWGSALNVAGFKGTRDAFVAAGDSVLKRLEQHVGKDQGHLFEQIDKTTGQQYNAEDLTWSYAEVLSALKERSLAMESVPKQSAVALV